MRGVSSCGWGGVKRKGGGGGRGGHPAAAAGARYVGVLGEQQTARQEVAVLGEGIGVWVTVALFQRQGNMCLLLLRRCFGWSAGAHPLQLQHSSLYHHLTMALCGNTSVFLLYPILALSCCLSCICRVRLLRHSCLRV
jgi:hypothetical protein